MKVEANLNPAGIDYLPCPNTKIKNDCIWLDCYSEFLGLSECVRRKELTQFEKRTAFTSNVSFGLGFVDVRKTNKFSKIKRNVPDTAYCAKLFPVVLKLRELNGGGVIMLRRRRNDKQLKQMGNRLQVFAFINDIDFNDFSKEIGCSLEDLRALAGGKLNQDADDTHAMILNSLSVQYGLNINWLLSGDGTVFSTLGPKTNKNIYPLSFSLNPEHENHLAHLVLFKAMGFVGIETIITQKVQEMRLRHKENLESLFKSLDTTCAIDFEFIREHFFGKRNKTSNE